MIQHLLSVDLPEKALDLVISAILTDQKDPKVAQNTLTPTEKDRIMAYLTLNLIKSEETQYLAL